MATADDGISSYESGGAGEKLRKTPIRTENSGGMSSDEGGNSGISELEQMLKQVTLTRYRFQHPATMEDLPDEMLTNIFIRLLTRQLAQMRSVSKSWNVLLSDPSFVKSHLYHSIHKNTEQIILVFPNYYKPFTQYPSKSLHLEPTNFIKHMPKNLPKMFIGAVHGLICLSERNYSNIHIWNPSLSAVSTIPPPHYLPPISSYEISLRFGYDPKTDDYKLVKISGIRNDDYFSVEKWLKVEAYSVKKGCWEFITQPFPSHITKISYTDHLCAEGHEGHLHWQTQTGPLREHTTILAFDLGSETFREIPLPDSLLDSNHISHKLGFFSGKLCEMSWLKDGGWEVWVMEEYGLPESWVIRHVFAPSQFNGEWTFPYGFTFHNQLLGEDEYGHLVLYDPIAGMTKATRLKQKTAVAIVEYVDSLVWTKKN